MISAVLAMSGSDEVDIKSVNHYCGRKLITSMKFFCQPHIKAMINAGYFEPLGLESTTSKSTDTAGKESTPTLNNLTYECCRNQCPISTLIKYCTL